MLLLQRNTLKVMASLGFQCLAGWLAALAGWLAGWLGGWVPQILNLRTVASFPAR